jgi:hypothetical protein
VGNLDSNPEILPQRVGFEISTAVTIASACSVTSKNSVLSGRSTEPWRTPPFKEGETAYEAQSRYGARCAKTANTARCPSVRAEKKVNQSTLSNAIAPAMACRFVEKHCISRPFSCLPPPGLQQGCDAQEERAAHHRRTDRLLA